MYPTREQTTVLAAYGCPNVNGLAMECPQCVAKEWCGDNLKIGGAMLAMHDALEAKQAELDGRTKALDWTANRCDELALEAGLLKIELDKAKDLIRRFVNDTDFRGLDTETYKELWNAYDVQT